MYLVQKIVRNQRKDPNLSHNLLWNNNKNTQNNCKEKMTKSLCSKTHKK